jgi:hypothetical protein
MLEKSDLGLLLTPAACDSIRARLSEAGFEGTIPALMLEETSPDTLTWRIAYYDRESVASAEFKALLLKCGEIELIVPQWNFAELMKGATLDWTGATFTINGETQIHMTRRQKRAT